MATANWEQELKDVKKEVSGAANEQIRLQTRLEEAKNRKSNAISKVKAKGIEPKDLKKTIDDKEKELEETIESIRECLPGDEADDSEEDED